MARGMPPTAFMVLAVLGAFIASTVAATGRRTVRVLVKDQDGSVIADRIAPLSTESDELESAHDVMLTLADSGGEGLHWGFTTLGGKPVVTEIEHRKANFNAGTGWFLSHVRLAEGLVDQNCGMADIVVSPGDTLEWQIMRLSEAPKPGTVPYTGPGAPIPVTGFGSANSGPIGSHADEL